MYQGVRLARCSLTGCRRAHESHDSLGQLPQFRARLSYASMYIRGRPSNDLTGDFAARPYTVFTLGDRDNGAGESDYRSGIHPDAACRVCRAQGQYTQEAASA
ncbi:hypothetical protein BCR43DRAFT_537046 [Syncephalastrum racemosum]|uniref:Uncharacterized protein n=1 Tax=Syncephalastrum racemosum TaxID=13706 RepID=A0A1X2H245_SYNRA|nr:hypothetical protein BCR43DRAFT_537046 [Syncephalastrum racemosum]